MHPVRAAVIAPNDEQRSLQSIRGLLESNFNGDPFQRVIYSESHDEVANGQARVPSEIDTKDSDNWFAQNRSTLAAALAFTAPGIPMLFQGQEFWKTAGSKIQSPWTGTSRKSLAAWCECTGT